MADLNYVLSGVSGMDITGETWTGMIETTWLDIRVSGLALCPHPEPLRCLVLPELQAQDADEQPELPTPRTTRDRSTEYGLAWFGSVGRVLIDTCGPMKNSGVQDLYSCLDAARPDTSDEPNASRSMATDRPLVKPRPACALAPGVWTAPRASDDNGCKRRRSA